MGRHSRLCRAGGPTKVRTDTYINPATDVPHCRDSIPPGRALVFVLLAFLFPAVAVAAVIIQINLRSPALDHQPQTSIRSTESPSPATCHYSQGHPMP